MITQEEHMAWFQRIGNDSNFALRIVESSGLPIGFFQLSGIKRDGVAQWGFYTSPESAKGSGKVLGRAALHYAFGTLGLYKVEGQALAFNTASIRFHERHGFHREGVLRHHCRVGEDYIDLVCFGLLREEFSVL